MGLRAVRVYEDRGGEEKMKAIYALLIGVGLCCDVLALPKSKGRETVVKDSTIENVTRDARINARDRSSVNVGIQARGAQIQNSTISSRFSGNVNASGSTVSTGVKADGATIKNSTITTDTEANISARNSTVKTGVDLSGASNAEISTKYRGNISASGAKVKAGTVEGNVRHQKISTDVNQDINAHGRGVEIGTVKANGGRTSVYEGNEGLDFSRERGRAGAQIGTVSVSGPVREVKTAVGTNDLLSGMRTRHMAEAYKETGGVDPTGTKHVYVNRRQKEQALKTGGSTGNTTTGGGRIRKVNTFVE
eukprot:TRINITY_DN4346_c0_g2_i4.p2 TRINITY_DN4346_c0_g2~~TRINITY_DN4346_c0_g2_i4.p2  ORF type:complete len:307 (-),score=67.51 TRINITY_DN4346_c0_g2_i4:440-1360(-)